MALLQPTDVPSRSGINNAITGVMDDHIDPADPVGLHYDSGWILLPLRAGFTFSGENPMYRRLGNVIYMRGRVARTSGNWTTGNTAIGDLPAGFRPSTSNILYATTIGSPGVAGRMFITSAGVVNVNALSGTPAGTDGIPLTASFPN